MMGQYGQRFGKYGMSRGLPVPEDRPTLARFLTDQGYVTGQIGKWDIGTKKQGPLEKNTCPLGEIPDSDTNEPVIPRGHGWAYASKNK